MGAEDVFRPEPAMIEGTIVRLEPLTLAHARGLQEATAGDEEVWRHLSIRPESLVDYEQYVEAALRYQADGIDIPFAIVEKSTGLIIGTTRFMDIRTKHRGLEIGSTFLASCFWGTGVNVECKYLLLRHAFEEWGCARVQLKTDVRNERSRAAILGIGATFEGVLRNHQIRRDGTLRDTALYSIIDREWPEVKTMLERCLTERPGGQV